jgi:hypothetical protein
LECGGCRRFLPFFLSFRFLRFLPKEEKTESGGERRTPRNPLECGGCRRFLPFFASLSAANNARL